MTAFGYLKWIHLLAAATWTGGLIILGPLVVALRRAGAERTHLQAVARAFARATWTALGVAVITGVWQVLGLGYAWGSLVPKIGFVALAAGLALFHQLTAKRTSAATRGVFQGAVLATSILVFGVAVATFG